jgi:GLPGLI family protein
MMKKLLPVLLLIALPSMASAQEGSITFNETTKIDIDLPPEMESMRDQIPDSRTTSKMLFFNDFATLMKDAPKDEEEDDDVVMKGGGMMIRMGGPSGEEETYINLDDGTIVEKRDFLGRSFRITGEVPEYQWRLTGEQSEYLGYACQKAVTMKDSLLVEAWFTSEIPVSAGPAGFNGLPGMILVVNIDNGAQTYTATGIDLGASVDDALSPPKGGKEMSRAEFDEMMAEKMEEMEATQGRHGGGMKVMIRHN